MSQTLGFVLKGYPRVSETFIAQEIYLLEQAGFSIEIFSMRQAREPQRQPIVAAIQARVTYLPEYIWPELASVARENFKVLLRRPSRYLALMVIALGRSLRARDDDPIKRFLQAGWLVGRRGLLGENGARPIGHLHAHFAHAPTELTWYAAKLSNLQYSISAHAKDIYTIAAGELVRRVRDSQFIMTCTSYNVEHLQALPRVSAAKVHLCYHGLDLETFRAQPRAPWTRDQLARFVSVGRLVEKKGYGDIFAALKMLKDRGIAFTYDIFGTGELLAELEALAIKLGINGQIVFHKTSVQPQIIARLQEGGIFLCGSRISRDGDRDGIPNTVAEAMAMELPVIATNVSGIPELIEHLKTGYLIPEKDPAALAAAIEDLLNHPELADQLSAQARHKVSEVFDAKKWIHRCANLLRPFTETRGQA